jgi:hypothetical protein
MTQWGKYKDPRLLGLHLAVLGVTWGAILAVGVVWGLLISIPLSVATGMWTDKEYLRMQKAKVGRDL